MKQMKNNVLLVLTALIWGCSFVAQSVGMDYVGPFTFNAVRCLIGAAVLIPVILFMDKSARKSGLTDEEMKSRRGDTKTLITGGICCGLALGIASSLQQWGILFTTVGKAGFITAMYIVLVPIFGIFLGKKVRLLIWFCVALAVAGLYFLCMNETFRLNTGDFLVILCAVCFSVHILVIDHFSPKVDGVRLSAIQFWVAGIACGIPMLIWEPRITGHSGSIYAASVCGSHVLRGGFYAADYSPKKCGPHCGISALKSGVRLFCAGRMGDSSSEPEHQRIVRLCAHVRSYYSGTAAGEEVS